MNSRVARYCAFLVSTICLLSCFTVEKAEVIHKEAVTAIPSAKEVPSTTIDLSDLEYQNQGGIWLLDGRPFSGHAERRTEEGELSERFAVSKGKKEGVHSKWHADGHLSMTAEYRSGKLNGTKKTWSADTAHVLLTHLNYLNGKGHGEQRKWYPTGELFQVTHLNMGREEGLQQAYRKNGDLYANYEAKAGRIFGMKKAALCFGIENNAVNYEGD